MRKMIRYMIAVASTGTVTLSLGMSAGAQDEPTAEASQAALEEFLPNLPPPEEIAAEPVAEGVIADASGEPVEDALVVLEVWPRPEDLATLEVGDVVPTEVVGKAVTDRNGEFELKLDDPEILALYGDEDGNLDVEVAVYTDSGLETLGGATVVVEETPGGELAPTTADSAVDEDPVIEVAAEVEDALEITEVVEELAATEQQQVGQTPSGDRWVLVENLGLRDAQFAHLASKLKTVTADLSFSKSSKTTVGWASSTKTATTGFSVAGTTSLTFSATVSPSTQGPKAFSTQYFTQVEYARYRMQHCATGWGCTWRDKWQVKPTGVVTGGFVRASGTYPPQNYCSKFNGTFVIDSQTQSTYSVGVDLKSKIGKVLGIDINASMQAGFSSSQKVTFKNSSKSNYEICGTTNYADRSKAGALTAR
jgi:hypothetical protein